VADRANPALTTGTVSVAELRARLAAEGFPVTGGSRSRRASSPAAAAQRAKQPHRRTVRSRSAHGAAQIRVADLLAAAAPTTPSLFQPRPRRVVTPSRISLAAVGVVGAVAIGASQAAVTGPANQAATAGALRAGIQQAPLPAAAGQGVLQDSADVPSSINENDTRVSRDKRDPITARPATTSLTPAPSHAGPGQAGLVVSGASVPGNWSLPTNGPYTSCFCARWGTFHDGIDLAGPLGTPIYAAGDGVVLDAGPASGFGNWVVIQHANGDVTIYGHMRYYFVHKGDTVKAGQQIALVGAEGQVTGPHLHLGVRQGGMNGAYIDPQPWLAARGIDIGTYTGN
jgi:murein DD-endopeptidase MepM/ murein hydrolase activator NlpD